MTQFWKAATLPDKISHDACVFELADPLPAGVANRALSLFDWSPKDPAKPHALHIPSNQVTGHSLSLGLHDPQGTVVVTRMEARFDGWKRGYAYLDKPSLLGQAARLSSTNRDAWWPCCRTTTPSRRAGR